MPDPVPSSAWQLLPGPRTVSMHSGIDVRRFFVMHVPAVVFPFAAGFFFYGWRALALVAGLVLATYIGTIIWRRIGARGAQLRMPHAIWLAILLAMALPAHLASGGINSRVLWPVIPAAGLVLVMFIWLLGGLGSGRIHPVLVTFLLLTVLFQQDLMPRRVLQYGTHFLGDVIDAPRMESATPFRDPWISGKNKLPGYDAMHLAPAGQQLLAFTSATERIPGSWFTLEGLIRDRLPPLEDFIIGGHPNPIGASSAIALLLGGLFLVYRGLIDPRIPLFLILAAYLAFLVLPVPVVITETGPAWKWLAGREHGVGWGLAVTFANYELLTGPLLFIAFFLSTAPSIRPMARRARVLYAILVGLMAAVAQLYVSVSWGPYAALLIASILTPLLDHYYRPRTLV